MEYELIHTGIKGMKWGVRRYQRKDGSLTPAGKKRYGAVVKDGPYEEQRKARDKLLNKKAPGADRLYKGKTGEALRKAKDLNDLLTTTTGVRGESKPGFTPAGAKGGLYAKPKRPSGAMDGDGLYAKPKLRGTVKGGSVHEDHARAHDNKPISQLSTKELQERNNRLQQEQNYQRLTKKTSVGQKVVKTFIATAGTIVAIEGAAKVYNRVGNQIIDKIGDMVINNIDLKKPLA